MREDYTIVSMWYKYETYVKAYNPYIHPMTSRLDMNGWKSIWHLYMVPKVKPQTGRPTKARNKKKKIWLWQALKSYQNE